MCFTLFLLKNSSAFFSIPFSRIIMFADQGQQTHKPALFSFFLCDSCNPFLMNIFFLSHYFPPEGNAPATRVHALAKRWVAAGHRVTVITCAPNVPSGVVYDGYRNCWRQEEIVDGIRVIRIWTYLAANAGVIKRTINYLSFALRALFERKEGRSADVVIATSPQFFCGIAGLLLAKSMKKPFVLDLRDLWPESIETVGAVRNRYALKVLTGMEHWMYRGAVHIVTVGPGYEEKLRERKVPDDRISIVSNGVDLSAFKTNVPVDQIRAKYNIPINAFICCYSGTIGMACGLDAVLAAAQKLQSDRPDHPAYFVFAGDGARRAELEQSAASQNIRNVVFTGLIAKKAVPELLSACNAALVYLEDQPLFRTVMPSKIFEAAAMSKPIVIGVPGYSAQKVVECGAGLAVKSGDITALCQAIHSLRDNSDLCRKMGEAAYQHLAEPYQWDNLARQYLTVLERIVSKTNRGGRGSCRSA